MTAGKDAAYEEGDGVEMLCYPDSGRHYAHSIVVTLLAAAALMFPKPHFHVCDLEPPLQVLQESCLP